MEVWDYFLDPGDVQVRVVLLAGESKDGSVLMVEVFGTVRGSVAELKLVGGRLVASSAFCESRVIFHNVGTGVYSLVVSAPGPLEPILVAVGEQDPTRLKRSEKFMSGS
jgi:hypothetical protein